MTKVLSRKEKNFSFFPPMNPSNAHDRSVEGPLDYDPVVENLEKLKRFLRRKDTVVLVHPLLEEGFGNFVAVNDVAIERYGYSREEFLKISAPDITVPVDSIRHGLRRKRQELAEQKHMVTHSEHITKSGRVIPVEIDAMVIPHEGRELIVATVHDLDERRKTERALIESEIRFRSILEKSADPMFLADTKGRFLDVNQAACDAMGYDREEILSMNICDLDPDSDEFNFEDQWEHVFRKRGEKLIVETRHQKKDGTIFPVEVHIAAFMHKGLKTMLGTARDITERKEQERKLRESEYRFRVLLQSVETLAVQGYWPDGTVFFWNKANEGIYGYTEEEALGKNLLDLIIPDEMREGVLQVLTEAGRTGRFPDASELCLKGKDGSAVWVYSSHVAVKVNDRFELYCLDVDLSERKEVERQKELIMRDLVVAKNSAEQANKAKDDFLAVMSHEMRTPLNPIVGFASLMREDCREDQVEAIDCILSSGNRLLNLIQDILDFARFESGNQTLQPSKKLLHKLFKEAITDVRDLAGELDLKFRNGFGDLEPIPDDLEVEFDYNGLLRVVDNLLTNACKYTDEGSVELQVGMRAEVPGQNTRSFVFKVVDTGIGIDRKNFGKLFEPFHQVDSSYTRSSGGIGLGLAVCKKLVDLMQGRLSVESEPGKGSTFILEVELPVSTAQSTVLSVSVQPKKRLLDKDMRILLVEDDESNRNLASAIIEGHGGIFESVVDGVEAVQRCCQSRFDVILMDLGMPRMDGLEATRQIRSFEQSLCKEAYIIALTADASGPAQTKCKEAGMDAFLSKPVISDQMIDTIKQGYSL